VSPCTLIITEKGWADHDCETVSKDQMTIGLCHIPQFKHTNDREDRRLSNIGWRMSNRQMHLAFVCGTQVLLDPVLHTCQGLIQFAGILAPGLRQCRTPTAATAEGLSDRLDQLASMQAARY